MSARTLVIEALNEIIDNTPGLEDLAGRVVEAARGVGDLSTPVILVKSSNYAPTPQAPTRNVTWTGTATLVSPHRDQEKSEDQLEALLEILAPKLLTASLRWTGAEFVAFDDNQHNALDIAIEAIFQKE